MRPAFTKEQRESWPEGYRGCGTCLEVKTLSAFHKKSTGFRGRVNECKECKTIRRKERYAKISLETKMCYRAKYRAQEKEVPFNLSPEDIDIPTYCPVLGIPLNENTGDGVPGPSDNSPSLDRLVPELGYVRGNVVVISNRANKIKSNATAEEIKKVYLWLHGHDHN